MADWNTSGTTSRTRNGGAGRRKHWKLPDMIQGVRHRFRDKRRSKSPDYCLDTDTASNNSGAYNGLPRSGASLPRAASMLSTDYGFGVDNAPTTLTRAVNSNMTPYRTNTWETNRVPPITVSRLQPSSSIDPDSSAVSSRLTSSSSSNRTHPPPALASVGRAQSSSAVNQTGLSSNGNSIQRGKSVRFGENRISVFLQDNMPTQALEECVRLALSYADEERMKRERGDYCSDTEAVTLSRSLARSEADPGHVTSHQMRPPWSDTEDRHQPRDRGRHDKTCAKNQTRTIVSSSSTSGEYSSGVGPPTPTNYKPNILGQAVNSLDRVERLEKTHQQKSRQKRSAQINEIFSFIDKILSGCDSGCNDERCPLVREAGQRSGHHRPPQPEASWSKQNKTYRFNSSSVSAEYQSNKKSSSVPGGYGSDSYAYNHLNSSRSRYQKSNGGLQHAEATPSEEAGAGGWASDSDCDSSDDTTLVTTHGQQHPRRPPRSRLRTQAVSRRSEQKTSEDVFAQIIVCCETSKESLGMPKYLHLHQKISQTVCNAIFLCKVIQYQSLRRLKYLEFGDKMQYLVQINFISALKRVTGYIFEKL